MDGSVLIGLLGMCVRELVSLFVRKRMLWLIFSCIANVHIYILCSYILIIVNCMICHSGSLSTLQLLFEALKGFGVGCSVEVQHIPLTLPVVLTMLTH